MQGKLVVARCGATGLSSQHMQELCIPVPHFVSRHQQGHWAHVCAQCSTPVATTRAWLWGKSIVSNLPGVPVTLRASVVFSKVCGTIVFANHL